MTMKKRRVKNLFCLDKAMGLRRKFDTAFHTIFKELKEEDSDGFKNYVSMDLITSTRYSW